MSVKASLLKRMALTLVAGVALALPSVAKADLLSGLSLRVGGFFPVHSDLRDVTDVAVWGGGIDYKIPWFPRLLNGEAWSTSISADFYYSERIPGVYRYFPASINQVYTFEERNGIAPYAGFSAVVATFGTSGTAPKQPMVTRFGAGLILGLNFGKNLYWENRYEWIDGHDAMFVPEGFRTSIGYRF